MDYGWNDHLVKTTGLASLDGLLGGGFIPGYLYVLAGRPGMGKTDLALTLTGKMLGKGKRIVYIDLETGEDILKRKLLFTWAGIPFPKISGTLSEEEKEVLEAFTHDIRWERLKVLDSLNSIQDLAAQASIEEKISGADLIILDGPEFMEHGERMSESILELKDFCRKFSIPVLLVTELDEREDDRPGNLPHLTDFPRGTQIAEIADAVLLLYRDDYYHDDSEERGIVRLFLSKNRLGCTGQCKMAYLPECGLFAELLPTPYKD